MTKEEMLYIDIPIDVAIDREIDDYFKDRAKREGKVILNQEIVDKFKNFIKKDNSND